MSSFTSSERPERRTVGIGSMVADRIHRVPHILGVDQKGILRAGDGGRTAELRAGGVVLNHLGWAAVLGLPVGIFGKQADDANGRFLRDAMDRFGIAKDLVLDGSASSFADIYVDDAGGRAIYMAPGATAETSYAHVRRHHERTIASALRVTTEVSQLPLAAANEACRLAEISGVPTLVDLDVPPSDALLALGTQAELEQLLRRAKILKPSGAAGRELVLTASGDALAIAKKLRERYGNEAVIVTDGEAGCAIATAKEALRVPAYAVARVVDTTGAGDAFLGGVLAGLAAGLGWGDIARLGNACGAACVEKLGAFPDDASAASAAVLARYDGAALPAWVVRGLAVVPEIQPAHEALVAFDVALAELAALRARVDSSAFERAVSLIDAARAAGGRVHVTGVGKPEHVARYGAALLASVGTPATFLSATETMHGSAGQVVRGDVVIAISNSGETAELIAAVGAVKALGAQVLAISGALKSSLAQLAAVVLDAHVEQEGGGLGLAPRASAAAELLVIAALSAALEHARGLTRAEYHALHLGGALGRKSGG
jgi:sugar/nucleoside kinase (ribokinase family)/D-arabinose 5-phosphate isomerase GutQ